MATLQRPKDHGGLALPNFRLYYWAFQLRPLQVWLEPNSLVPWRKVEASSGYYIFTTETQILCFKIQPHYDTHVKGMERCRKLIF